MQSSLEKLFETSINNFDKQIIKVNKLTDIYKITLNKADNKIIINSKEFQYTKDDDLESITTGNYKQIKTYCELMKNTQKSIDKILLHTLYVIKGTDEDIDDTKKNIIAKIYFLLNNIEILFLFDTFDYKLITRILNRDNYINDIHYKKACFIAMVVFEFWSLTKKDDINYEISENDTSFYKQLLNSSEIVGDYVDLKRYKRIHDLIHEIKDDARAFVNSPDFDYALKHNTFEIEIPKRNLDNIIKPLSEIKQTDNRPTFSFNFPDPTQKDFDGSILPKGIYGGVRRIQGGDEAKLNDLKVAYNNAKFNDTDNGYSQTRFLFDCLITANSKGAKQCMKTLSISTAKIDSYKIVETIPRATLVKLATVLGIIFPNDKIETYDKWIERTKTEAEFKDYVDQTTGEVLNTPPPSKPTETYKQIILIHYIGNVIIDKLGGKNVEYDILRAQNKAKVQFTKISGPEVSYRTKSNYTNFKSNSRSLSLSSNPIFMNMNLYSQQSPEQLDRIKSGLISGGAADAQLYSSVIYERAINQALNKYKSMNFKINPNDMKIIDDTINNLKNIEVKILDTYSKLMNVLQFSTMINNPSFMASLSEEEKNKVEEAWKNRNPEEILKLKNKLDKELKEKQILADNAKTILDIIFPWKKSLDKIAENTKDISEIKESIKKIPTSPKIELPRELIEKLNEEERFNFIKQLINNYSNRDNKRTMLKNLIKTGTNHFEKIISRDHAILIAKEAELNDLSDPTLDEFINTISIS